MHIRETFKTYCSQLLRSIDFTTILLYIEIIWEILKCRFLGITPSTKSYSGGGPQEMALLKSPQVILQAVFRPLIEKHCLRNTLAVLSLSSFPHPVGQQVFSMLSSQDLAHGSLCIHYNGFQPTSVFVNSRCVNKPGSPPTIHPVLQPQPSSSFPFLHPRPTGDYCVYCWCLC